MKYSLSGKLRPRGLNAKMSNSLNQLALSRIVDRLVLRSVIALHYSQSPDSGERKGKSGKHKKPALPSSEKVSGAIGDFFVPNTQIENVTIPPVRYE